MIKDEKPESCPQNNHEKKNLNSHDLINFKNLI